jgi:hypothetical protein
MASSDSEVKFPEFMNLRTFDMTHWTGDLPDAMFLPTQDNTTQKNANTSIPRVGFEPVIPVFERPKTVHELDRADIGTCSNWNYTCEILYSDR